MPTCIEFDYQSLMINATDVQKFEFLLVADFEVKISINYLPYTISAEFLKIFTMGSSLLEYFCMSAMNFDGALYL